jgi:hypothetical protein
MHPNLLHLQEVVAARCLSILSFSTVSTSGQSHQGLTRDGMFGIQYLMLRRGRFSTSLCFAKLLSTDDRLQSAENRTLPSFSLDDLPASQVLLM